MSKQLEYYKEAIRLSGATVSLIKVYPLCPKSYKMTNTNLDTNSIDFLEQKARLRKFFFNYKKVHNNSPPSIEQMAWVVEDKIDRQTITRWHTAWKRLS